ncbi:LamB/YcsF family protein [Streptomyces armeniacus]|uniref:LamB/YcsF family protein n=1 Tax=Streptomyces armeniacus TaxID=83291 RepID=A0A345XS51_9ACTN|nr:5-oxoprolinase subunit PxpA [Streptomyces armeniacus]AXK34467.1 LamB/YcsF family protein [Streptomyces armeniacus]
MKTRIDLNADAGESFGRWRLGHDEALLPLVSSVNVACGWHAGDPAIMRHSVGLARSAGTALGAHPGLPDLAGFGRRALALSPREAADACLYQYGALRGFADAAGVRVTHVKPHGAFYGLTMRNPDVADAVADAVAAVDPEAIVVLLAGPTAERVAARGLRVAREAFADLEYDDEGHIVIEPDPPAKDPQACAEKAAGILRGHVTTRGGRRIEVDADTVCVHGDRPNAVEVATAVRDRIAAEGAALLPMGEVLARRGA